jgi:hypothetical protein
MARRGRYLINGQSVTVVVWVRPFLISIRARIDVSRLATAPRSRRGSSLCPDLLTTLTERWQLELGPPIPRGTASAVFRCRQRDGRPSC